MGFGCLSSWSHFHNLFEEFCSIFIKLNVQIVYLPGYCGPVIVWEALVSEAGLAAGPQLEEHNTGNVALAPLPKPQHTDGGEQKACVAHHISAALPAFPPQPSWVCPLPPFFSTPPQHAPLLSTTDKRPRSKGPNVGPIRQAKEERINVTRSSH
jgi:hypothetical protein